MTATDRSLIDRWRTPAGARLAHTVVRHLVRRKSLDRLGLGTVDGRLDLRGLSLPEPRVVEKRRTAGVELTTYGEVVELKKTQLHSLDLSFAHLPRLELTKVQLENVKLEGAHCRNWRLFAVDVRDSSFASADLCESVLGPWYKGGGNHFSHVDFSRADLRGIICPAAYFTDCDFAHARLDKVDFNASSFVRCRFAGEVREVIFHGRDLMDEKRDPNPMEDIDFSQASLPWADFRHLDLDRVTLPVDEDHLILHHYPCVLRRALRSLEGDDSSDALVERDMLEYWLKWSGPNQQVGIFHNDALGDTPEAVAEFRSLLLASEAECEAEAASG